MIFFNGNKFKTINDKLYFGSNAISKVYYGNTLIYPETIRENEIPTEGGKSFVLDPKLLNGCVYDTGYSPNKYTCVEICFSNKNGNISSGEFGGFAVFGTHHDVYYATSNNGSQNNGEYNPLGDDGDWGNGLSRNGWNQWKNRTTYHFIIKSSELWYRMGGVAVQGTTSDENVSSLGSDYSINNSDYNTGLYDSSFINMNWDVVSNFSHSGATLNGKFFSFTVDYNKFHIDQGIGRFYTGSTNFLSPIVERNIDTSSTQGGGNSIYVKRRGDYNSKYNGGNLWIGTHNRNYSSTTNAVNPNLIRNHISYDTFKSNPLSSISFHNDIKPERFTTGNLEWVYVIIQEKNFVDGSVKYTTDSQNVKHYIKYLYIPVETTITIPNTNSKYVVFMKYETSDCINWNTEPSEVIYPFMRII